LVDRVDERVDLNNKMEKGGAVGSHRSLINLLAVLIVAFLLTAAGRAACTPAIPHSITLIERYSYQIVMSRLGWLVFDY